MTLQEFNNQGWTGKMKAKYENNTYDVVKCDFQDKTVGLDINGMLIEASYEFCEIIEEKQ